MKIRLVGSKDLIQDIYDIFKLKVKIYEDKYNPNNPPGMTQNKKKI